MDSRKSYSLGQKVRSFQRNNDQLSVLGENRIYIFEKMCFKFQIDLKEDNSELKLHIFDVQNFLFVFKINEIIVIEKDGLEIFKKYKAIIIFVGSNFLK